MDIPTKNKLEIKLIVSGVATSVWIVFVIGTEPSITPWIKRITKAGYTRSHSPNAIIQTTFTMNEYKNIKIHDSVIIIDIFLPIRSANHPQNTLPMICPRKKSDAIQEL